MLRSIARREILREGAWVAFGQLGAALGALVGVRLLTEVLEPGVYGLVMLILGVAALGQGLGVTPFMQAVLRFHPESAQVGTVATLRAVTVNVVKKVIFVFAAISTLVGLLYGVATGQPVWLGVLVAGIFASDSLRSFETTLLNAARRQREMAWWSAADAWAKPLAAIAAVAVWSADAGTVLLGYLGGSVVLAGLVYHALDPEGMRQTGARNGRKDGDALRRRMWLYAIPLVPVAAAGWVSGVGDRYLIGGMLGLADAGIYAAAYALVSRPFLMMSSMLELTARPIYYQALGAGDGSRAGAALRGWIVLSVVGGGLGLILIWLLKDILAWLLLAEPYRAAASLMPWIAAGYCLLAVSHVFARVCYAYHDTKAVLWIEASGAVLAMAVMIPAILWFGLVGAAMAVPVYFGAQLGIAVMLARRADRHRTMALAAQ
jgi:O-antigen/teichoic acid export membrane protein